MPDDPAHIEALQAQKAEDAQQAVKEAALRQALYALDRHCDNPAFPYEDMLLMLREVVDAEVQRLRGTDKGDPHGTL